MLLLLLLKKLIFLQSLLLLSLSFFTTSVVVEAEDILFSSPFQKDDILSVQRQLASLDEESEQSLAAEIASILESKIQFEANYQRNRWIDFGRPNDRLDDSTIVEFRKGMPVWWLLEIPQWWVTGVVWDVIVDEENGGQEKKYQIHVTSTGMLHTVSRDNMHVRACRLPQDITLWLSEHARDTGELARVNGNEAERKRQYELAVQLDPNNPHPIDNMGIYWIDHDNWENVVEWYERSLRVQPHWYHTYYNYGLLLQHHTPPHLQDGARVFDLYHKAFELNPLFLDTLWNVAHQYELFGMRDIECFSWRLLRELNRNPSPEPHDRPFTPWNPHWETALEERINICMKAIAMAAAEAAEGQHDGEL